ncbi:DUF1501 domain-containing protein [Nocardioides sp.]|uniref:DUF1501 domain-containing protein n=1 Tax=Nocardioides sp. TaxID=35761 RepID=UPI003514910E
MTNPSPAPGTATPAGLAADGCCDDHRRLSRRGVLRGGTLAAGAGVATSLVGDVLTASVFGAEPRGSVLVVLSQRGGVDGLSMVVPHGEPAYYRARPGIAIPRAQLLHRDAMFGLHPALAPLSPWWQRDAMAAVHAVGLPAPNRSHFSAIEEVEDADPGSDARVGWLNRLIGALGDQETFEGVAVGTNVVPTALIGPTESLAIATPQSLGTPFAGGARGDRVRAGLQRMYDGESDVARAGRNALELSRRGMRYSREAAKAPQRGASYPATPLGTSMRNAAALIRSGLGVRAIAVDSGSWDHHLNLRALMQRNLADLAGSLAAFFTDLGPDAQRVTLVTLSEFGRRVAENGAAGTDHGYGNSVLLMGAGVRGGRYYARWPGLAEGRLVEGDLAVTTDYRSLLIEILQSRFPSVDTAAVFPGVTLHRLGALTRR